MTRYQILFDNENDKNKPDEDAGSVEYISRYI